jgi:tRNA A-37 threonylcarbamoyl transferase component Bud32/DNA-binding NarL/FixJ family response regulator
MKLSVLLIDDAEEYRVLCAELVRTQWPDALVEPWDPVRQGMPRADQDLSRYDVILLDFRLGEEDGLEWLKILRSRAGCPPIVMVTGAGSEELVLTAMRAGAIDYIPKATLSVGRLAVAIGEALALSSVDPSFHRQRPGHNLGHQGAAIALEGYRMMRQIGIGASSVIYLAEQIAGGTQVAVKLLRSRLTSDPEMMRRFEQERKIVLGLKSRYVARVYDQGVVGDRAYIVMEYFEGGDLKREIAQGIERARAVELLYRIGQALAHLHDEGIIHRDLKPENIMFRGDGSLAILDFGIAKLAVNDAGITQLPMVLGTPFYMSPEQAGGDIVDSRTDLYSAGVIFYEMLRGIKPFLGDNFFDVIAKHRHQPVPALPHDLARYQDVVDRLIAKRAADRFRDARELLDYLEARFEFRG